MEVKHLLCINGHNDRIWSVAWSPLEDLFVTSSSDCKVKFWRFRKTEDPEGINRCTLSNPDCGAEYTYELEFEIDNFFKKTVRSVKFSPDGRHLICASFDGTSSIWTRASSTEQEGEKQPSRSNKSHWVCLATLEGHENEVKCASFDVSGNYIASCGRDKTIWIYEKSRESGERDYEDLNKLNSGLEYFCSAILTGHTHDVKHVCWNPVALVLASASYDNSIRIWTLKANDWYCIQALNLHTNTVWCLSFNSEGTQLASCSSDRTLFIYQSKVVKGFIESTKIPKPCLNRFAIMNTSFPVPSLRNGTYHNNYGPLVADDWEVKRAFEELHSRPIYSVDFGELLITAGGDNKVKIIDPNENFSTIHEVAAHSSDVNAVSWKPGCKERVFASVGDDEYIRLWKVVYL